MSQFIKFPTSEPPLGSLCYPRGRQAGQSRACGARGRGWQGSCRPFCHGQVCSAPKSFSSVCWQLEEMEINTFLFTAGRSCCSRLSRACVPSRLAPGKLHPVRVPGGSPGRKYGPREGAPRVPPLPSALGFISFRFISDLLLLFLSQGHQLLGSSYRDLLDKSPRCSGLISRIHK